MTPDAPTRAAASTHAAATTRGLVIALISAGSFGMAGALAKGLLDAGWTPASAVTARVLGAFLILAIPAYRALRGRWHLLARNWSLLVGYGLVAVAVAQLGYFNAVKHMSVSSALLMEYTAPVVVVGWMWFRHHERPSQMTWIGALLAAAGLALVLDLMSGTTVSGAGMMWGTIAMLGGATYFIISAHDNDLPPLVLAAGGLLLGGVAMCIAGLLGVVEMNMSTADVLYRGVAVPWWLPVLALCLVAAAISYVTGIIASRILGARVASFVALTEVVFAVVWAWLLIAELPGPMQLFGGCLVIAGVIVVKLGERPGTREFENPLNPV